MGLFLGGERLGKICRALSRTLLALMLKPVEFLQRLERINAGAMLDNTLGDRNASIKEDVNRAVHRHWVQLPPTLALLRSVEQSWDLQAPELVAVGDLRGAHSPQRKTEKDHSAQSFCV